MRQRDRQRGREKERGKGNYRVHYQGNGATTTKHTPERRVHCREVKGLLRGHCNEQERGGVKEQGFFVSGDHLRVAFALLSSCLGVAFVASVVGGVESCARFHGGTRGHRSAVSAHAVHARKNGAGLPFLSLSFSLPLSPLNLSLSFTLFFTRKSINRIPCCLTSRFLLLPPFSPFTSLSLPLSCIIV